MRKSFCTKSNKRIRTVLYDVLLGKPLKACYSKNTKKLPGLAQRPANYYAECFKQVKTNQFVLTAREREKSSLTQTIQEYEIFSEILKKVQLLKFLDDNVNEPFLNYMKAQNPKQINPLTRTEKDEILKKFKKVKSFEQMQRFCEDSKSIYLKACSWLQQNQSKINNPSKEKHHIYPKFYFSNIKLLQKAEVLTKFNEVAVPRDIHMYLHLLRFKEFQDTNDSLALFVTLGKVAKKKDNLFFSELVDELENEFLNHNLSFKEIQTQQLLICSLGGRKSAILNKDNQKLLEICLNNLRWKNDNFKIHEKEINLLDSIDTLINIPEIQVNEKFLEDNFIIRDYVWILIKLLPEKDRPENWETEKELKKYVRSLKNYLLGIYGEKTTILDWELINITPEMNQWREEYNVNHRLKTTKKDNKVKLEQKRYIWKPLKYTDKLPEVKGKEHNFSCIADIAKHLLQLVKDNLTREEIKLLNLENTLKTYFESNDGAKKSQINRRFSQVFQQRSKRYLTVFNWKVEFY